MPHGGFLPPQPPGPEPDLGGTAAGASGAGQPGGFAPPVGAMPTAAPGQLSQRAWAQPQALAATPRPPDNGPAVLGLCLALSSIGLLVISAGLSSLVSLAIGIVGIVQGAKGRRLVREGHTTRHKDLSQAAFVIGIVATVLAALATLAWIVVGVVVAVDASTRNDFEQQFHNQPGEPAVIVLAAIRVVGLLLT